MTIRKPRTTAADKAGDKPTPAKPTPAKPPIRAAKPAVTLDDLNHDPSLVETLNKTEVIRLIEKDLQTEEAPSLAGSVFSRLNQRYNELTSPED